MPLANSESSVQSPLIVCGSAFVDLDPKYLVTAVVRL